MRLHRYLIPPLLILLALMAACSDSTAPDSNDPRDGGASFDGAFDAGDGSFVLKRIDASVPGQQPVYIELIGTNIQLDEVNETVSVDVAMRNVGTQTLYPPANLWLGEFEPAEVAPINADYTLDAPTASTDPMLSFGYDYSDLLGEDDALAPEELSGAKTWILRDPGLGSFAFAALAAFGMEPDRPVISGTVFNDSNRNGVQDPDEGAYRAGGITVVGPDGTWMNAALDETGFYRVPIKQTGLHTVRFVSFLECIACWCETTPNPLEVLITPGPDGEPRSFTQAHFGIYPGPCFDPPTRPIAPVALTDLSPEQIDQDPYQLLGSGISGELLRLRVGFGGCSDEHPFTLYAGQPFMESMPVQTWMLLAHDDLGEECDAAFERTLYFDLAPIQDAYIEAYGEPGVVILRFRDFHGMEKMFRLEPHFVRLSGTITNIVDATPVDGGVTIDLELENGETARLLFGTMFTPFEQPMWRVELYQVIMQLSPGDNVQAMGRPAEGGVELRTLNVLD